MSIFLNKDEIINRQKDYTFCYYLELFVEANKEKFPGVILRDIFDAIFNDKILLVELMYFMADKYYLLTFEEKEVAKIKEKFYSDLN